MTRKANNSTTANLADMASTMEVFGAEISTMEETGPCVDELEAQMLDMPHLADDLRYEDGETIHECRDARQLRTAVEHIRRIPGPTEALHLLCSGRYALWDMVPAIFELANSTTPPDCVRPIKIESLHLATLGFSRLNVAEIVAMLDAGAVGSLSLLCSHYFKGTSGGIWELAAEELAKRPQARFLSIRTHCKLVCARLSDGRTITIESSANLRSCKNIEQMSLFGHPNLYAFHVGWMDELFSRGIKP